MDNFLELLNEFEKAVIEVRENDNEHYKAVRAQLTAAWDASQREAAQAGELRAAAKAFTERVGEWVMGHNESIKLATALAFGEEYEKLKEILTRQGAITPTK
jgi:FKBP-type peptidyl-prolyl cis-trans isomerase 2